MTKLEQLTKRIQELVPEIMEFKFGCKIKFSPKDGLKSYSKKSIEGFFVEQIEGTCITVQSEGHLFYYIHKFQNLGREITLEDVLKALLLSETPCTGINVSGAWMCGSEYLAPLMKQSIEGTHWQHLTPLHLQKEKTIKLLFNFLCE